MVKLTQFLGIHIDEKLTRQDHNMISVVKSKLSKAIGIIYRPTAFLNQSSLFTLSSIYDILFRYNGETHIKVTPYV